jgi:hypothetical protein
MLDLYLLLPLVPRLTPDASLRSLMLTNLVPVFWVRLLLPNSCCLIPCCEWNEVMFILFSLLILLYLISLWSNQAIWQVSQPCDLYTVNLCLCVYLSFSISWVDSYKGWRRAYIAAAECPFTFSQAVGLTCISGFPRWVTCIDTVRIQLNPLKTNLKLTATRSTQHRTHKLHEKATGHRAADRRSNWWCFLILVPTL